jgi:shikimate kinase
MEKKTNIAVIGLSGAGKSALAEMLAMRLGYGVFDTDAEVERKAGRKISDVFTKDGEDTFRRLESEQVARLEKISYFVVALGSGAVSDDENWKQIQKNCHTLWLNVPHNEIAKRLYRKPSELLKRPLFANLVEVEDHDTRQKLLIEALGEQERLRRIRFELADLTVDAAYTTPEQACSALIEKLSKEYQIDYN